MKSRKLVWIAALCVLSAGIITISLRTHSMAVLAAQHSVTRASLAQPAAYMSSASLRAAAISNAMLLDEAGSAQRVSLNLQRNSGPLLPPVEEFTLTPPNPALNITKTTVAVRFPELPAEKLASQIPMTLGTQSVVLQRSTNDPRLFSTQVDFDWLAFAKEQQQRKDLANAGKVIPVFEGRRLARMDKVEFVDPSEIDIALQSHQPVQFTARILEGTGVTIEPASELTITNLAVVTDTTRTWDSCSGAGTQMGAWTFGQLATAMTGTSGSQLQADAMVEAWFSQWLTPQPVNSFTVAARNLMANIISPTNWPHDSAGNVDVSRAPFQLNAIVNRIDLGAGSTPTGGELRFVFGLCSTTGPVPFDIIFEYGVPASVASGCTGVQNWANEWHNLDITSIGSPAYNAALQAITDQVVTAGADSTKPFGSALDQARSNENLLSPVGTWEQRQFQLISVVGAPTLHEGTIAQTPDSQNPTGDFNGANSPPGGNADVLTDYINLFASQIIAGTYTVPASFSDPLHGFSGPFLGGSVFNAGTPAQPGFWNGCHPTGGSCLPIVSNIARSDFSVGTCNGCHGRETANNVSFQQVSNRVTSSGSPSVLSAFLLGCNNGGTPLTSTCPVSQLYPLTGPGQESVQDPVVSTQINTFGDLVRRETYLSGVLGGSCTSDQLLQSLVRHRDSFVH
jgi:hypothetical protein